MINIQFGESNSAQEPVCKLFNGLRLETLYVKPENAQDLRNIMQDIRFMEEEEFQSIIKTLSEIIGK